MADEPRRWPGWLESDADAHPDAPAGGSGPGSSRLPGLLGPSSPFAARHPDASAARLDNWRPHAPGAAAGRGRTAFGQHGNVEKHLQRGFGELRDQLPDPSLARVFAMLIDRMRGMYGPAHGRDQGGDRDMLLRRLHKSVAWIDPAFFAGPPGSGGVVAAAGQHGTLAAMTRDPAAAVRAFESSAARVFEAAGTRLRERWADATRGGVPQQEALLHEWRQRLESHVVTRPSGLGERAVRLPSRPSDGRMPPPPPPSRTVKTWVEFQMVDEDGQPVPNVAYNVTLPDGARRTGRLDGEGKLRFDGIDPGECVISFPEIDGREWRPA